MSSGSSFNPHYPAPSAEVLVRLRRSELEAEQITTRDLRCPICNFWVAKIPVKQTDLVFVKCQKCKFQGALSPAYFLLIEQAEPVLGIVTTERRTKPN